MTPTHNLRFGSSDMKPFTYIDCDKAVHDRRKRSVLDSNVKPAHYVKPAPSSVIVKAVATRHVRPKSSMEKRAIRNMRAFKLDPAYAAWKGI